MSNNSPHLRVDVLIAAACGSLRAELRTVLEEQGYACAEARDGAEAVELASLHAPPCLFLDLGIPVLDFVTVVRRLQESPRTRGIRIHCLTSRTDEAARNEAARAGCDSVLTTPVETELLLDLVRRQSPQTEATCVTGLTQDQARDLLDWLENNGYPPATVEFDGKAGFTVRYAPCQRGERSPSHVLPPLSQLDSRVARRR